MMKIGLNKYLDATLTHIQRMSGTFSFLGEQISELSFVVVINLNTNIM